jgi:hypothetical protein
MKITPPQTSLLTALLTLFAQLFRFYATASDDKPGKNPSPQASGTMNMSSMSGSRGELNGTKSQLSNRLANAIG